jgi:hypothetical protein
VGTFVVVMGVGGSLTADFLFGEMVIKNMDTAVVAGALKQVKQSFRLPAGGVKKLRGAGTRFTDRPSVGKKVMVKWSGAM